jgi:ssRNA-specific RNase YbeY (16S rRNA maturation enzyme)
MSMNFNDYTSDPLELTLRRLEAITHTLSLVRGEIYDPEDPDTRGDLLISAYGVANEAYSLLNEVKDLVWPLPEHANEQEGY